MSVLDESRDASWSQERVSIAGSHGCQTLGRDVAGAVQMMKFKKGKLLDFVV